MEVLEVTNPSYDQTTGKFIETSIELEPTPTEKQADYEIEFVKNQNRIMSLWNEIVQ
jgi:hypothetical protein